MKRRILIVTLSLITLLGSALYVAASPPGGPCNGVPCDGHCDGPGDGQEQPGGRFLERMTKILDLTEAQQASIKKVLAAEQEKTAALHEKKRENRQQLRSAEEAKPFDENAIRVLAEQRGAIEAELTIARARAHSQIDALLTPEQRELAAKLRPEPGERHKGRKGGHR